MDWKPIESAPKDGTRILAGRFSFDKKDEWDGRVRVDWYRQPGEAGFTGWGHFNQHYWPATHWQPLPAPPAEGGVE